MAVHLNRQERAELSEKLFNSFKIPSWAGKPQMGLHLDVLKDGKLVQKLMIDEKKCYFFGRNRQLCDFPVDHESCSRVHAALVWHKVISRPFLIDLGSTHGTFIGSCRLESHKPQQVPIDSEIHFGASSRVHIVREKPQHRQRYLLMDGSGGVGGEGGLSADGVGGGVGGGGRDREGNYLGLPQTESELDNLTEFNTAQNRRIAAVVTAAASANTSAANASVSMQDADVDDEIGSTIPGARKRRRPVGRACVTFADEDDVINPEDVDPSVGRFRNLVYETFIPTTGKQARLMLDTQQHHHQQQQQQHQHSLHYHQQSRHNQGDDSTAGAASASSAAAAPAVSDSLATSALTLGAFSAAAKLGLALPNLAPDVDLEPAPAPPTAAAPAPGAASALAPVGAPNPATGTAASAASGGADEAEASSGSADTPRKKKYAKEAWPGKRPGFLVSGMT